MSVSVGAIRDFRSLRDDDGGAVMLVGLCMACFLIGALWFLIGIGDAIVFRDTMQEATDHAAFTSAALHAKGMNFIAAMNVILLAIVALHILLGVIHDVLLVICIVGLPESLLGICETWWTARKVYTGYAKVMKKAAKAIAWAEKGAAYGYPYVAFAKGRRIGNEYGEHSARQRSINMIPLSTSLVPGNVLVSPVNTVFRTSIAPEDKKAGLPVTPKPMNELCKKLAQVGIDKVLSLSGYGSGFPGKDKFEDLVGGALHLRYCNGLGLGGSGIKAKLLKLLDKIPGTGGDSGSEDDGKDDPWKKEDEQDGIGTQAYGAATGSIDPGFDVFWGKRGPLVPWSGTANGNPWQQVWAINVRPSFSDGSEHAVAIAAGKLGVGQTASPSSYYAQAEFYFDCTQTWDHGSCNGDDNAGYALKWRARMRRFDNRWLGFGESLSRSIGSATQAIDGFSQSVRPVLDQLGSLGDGIDSVVGAVEHAGDVLQDTANSNPITATPYH